MRTSALLLALLLGPPVAQAQPWLDAYKKGDYTTAADLLHEIVTARNAETTIEPAVAQHLAGMYARGAGVPADPIMACALAQFADMRAQGVGGERYLIETSRAAELVLKYCEPLTREERTEAVYQIGCFTFGIPPEPIELAGRAIQLTSRGLAFADTPGDVVVHLQCVMNQVATLRATTIQPPGDAIRGVRPRYFVEVFGWSPSEKDGLEQRALVWHVAELRGQKLGPVVWGLPVLYVPGRAWQRPAMPEGFESRLTFEMIRSGQVRWRLAGVKPRHGWILLPETESSR